MGFAMYVSLLTALMLPSGCLSAMERIDALSQIESRNNDQAIGRQQEVSRYQILPVFWGQATGWNKQVSPTDRSAAKSVVDWIMGPRCQQFQTRYHREPTDFEYYILWHRPACLVGRPIPRHLTSAEEDRGRRFASLCQSSD
ncbi:MAG: hypothetical protein ABSH48_06960 [Verrucomicrobiota bacterium]|jgi:hypothetical protein